jgi:imidazolonepropionase-like amidohydrolase
VGKRFTAIAEKKCITICAGTDLDDNKFVQREMKILVEECGFTPMQSVKAATRNGAMALGLGSERGTIEKGKKADLLLLSADPSQDINNIDKTVLVIKNGKLFNPAN